ncbi:MAG TPA: tryptophan 2,3-dioxygenase family protein [Chitinophagales bacterium]|nr:tryptophan 2,3-dioxygenase [Chitinophagales bacterium]HMU68526.1 tryptophan 2,3-dioxygenase family protein [Chitinophagales bacterium]HMZ88402.1 tryptophan 2,3-dioxygenase family protein [Chitinophagales bacterium]HNA56668.1 tryptophan 2,3-dioxygenase family protein [Chitinophagales bacterium]
MSHKPVEYTEYLQLDKILNAQSLESDKAGAHAHDEMLFIIIHQAYELWFKQVHFEVDSALQVMGKPEVNDNSPELQTVVHRLDRVVTILKVLVHQIDILETMTPLDFHEFRDFLRPASGFQSWQFKMLEAKLGLKFDNRYGKEYYTSMLKPQYVDLVKDVESQKSLLEMLDDWLARMPFFSDDNLWKSYQPASQNDSTHHVFWNDYLNAYSKTLVEGEQHNKEIFASIFLGEGKSEHTSLSNKAMRNALFISLYRGYPLMHLPFQLMQHLLDIDEQMATWRFRHINMVHRMIGSRVGTGGSSGKEYLQGALNKHYIFKDFAVLSSFLIQRNKLPHLSSELNHKLGFM